MEKIVWRERNIVFKQTLSKRNHVASEDGVHQCDDDGSNGGDVSNMDGQCGTPSHGF